MGRSSRVPTVPCQTDTCLIIRTGSRTFMQRQEPVIARCQLKSSTTAGAALTSVEGYAHVPAAAQPRHAGPGLARPERATLHPLSVAAAARRRRNRRERLTLATQAMLLVDGHPTTRAVTAQVLRDEGFDTLEAPIAECLDCLPASLASRVRQGQYVRVSAQLGPVIGRGRHADVYDLGNGFVLRRYRYERDTAAQALAMRSAREAGYPVPAVVNSDGRDLVMERVEGPTMLQRLVREPWRMRQYAAVLADLHSRLHIIRAPDELEEPGWRWSAAHSPGSAT